MNLADAELRTRKRHARLLLEAELPDVLKCPKKPFPEQRVFWVKGMGIVDSWAKSGLQAGCLLQGGTGRGKSELISLMLFMLADLYGKDALYLNAKSLSFELQDSYKPEKADARSEYQILKLAEERDVIVVDDLGGEGNEREALHVKRLVRALIDLHASSNKLFLMAANLGDDGLKLLLGDDREESRRAPWARVIFPDTVPDYRRGRL